jgi:hypothetical protein
MNQLNHLSKYIPMDQPSHLSKSNHLYELNDDWVLQIFNHFSEKDSVSFGLSCCRILKLFYVHHHKIFTESFATKNVSFGSDINMFYRLAKRVFHSHLPMVNLALFTFEYYYYNYDNYILSQMIKLCENENILDVTRKQMYVDYYDRHTKIYDNRLGVICGYSIKWIFLLYDHTFPEIDNLTRYILSEYGPQRSCQNILSILQDDYIHLAAVYNSFARILDSFQPGNVDGLLDVLIMAHEKGIVIENTELLLKNLKNRSSHMYFTKSYAATVVPKLVRVHRLLNLKLSQQDIWHINDAFIFQ